MPTRTFLGLDIGTLGVKGVIVTADGQVIARARLDHGVSHPQPGWAEQDAEARWWGDGVSIIRELLATPGVDADRIAAIGVCGLTPCLCLVDAEGRPLRPAILYSDNRALTQLAHAQAVLGLPLTAQAITPKWAWLAEHEPEVVRQARWVLSSHNYRRPSADRRRLDGLRHCQHRRRRLRRATEGVELGGMCGFGIGCRAAAASTRCHRRSRRRDTRCGAGDRSATGHAGDRGHRRHFPHHRRLRGRGAGRRHDLVRHHRLAHPHDATAGDSGGRAALRGGGRGRRGRVGRQRSGVRPAAGVVSRGVRRVPL